MGSNGIGLWPELMFRSSSSSSPSVLRLRWVGWGAVVGSLFGVSLIIIELVIVLVIIVLVIIILLSSTRI